MTKLSHSDPAFAQGVRLVHPPDLPARLTVQELAALWRVTPRTIERRVKAGDAPTPVRLGGRVLFRREDVLAWEAAQIDGAGG